MANDVNINHARPSGYIGSGKESISAALLLFAKSHQHGAPSYPNINSNDPSSITPVKTIVSDKPSKLSIKHAYHPSRPLREPPAIEYFKGVDDDVFRISPICCLISYGGLWLDYWNSWISLLLLICVSPALFIYITNDLFASFTPVNFRVSVYIHPSHLFVPAIENLMGVDDVLMRSVGLYGLLDLFDCLFYYWRNMVMPLFLDCVGRLVAIPY